MANVLPFVEVISKTDCCLCDVVKAHVVKAAAADLCSWKETLIDGDAALLKQYGLDIPVILINGKKRFKHQVEPAMLYQALQNACA
ncbi:MAG: glutaredoxin family protein [Mariprofundaceae bacterium]